MKTIHKFLMMAAFGFAHPFHAAAFQSSEENQGKTENQRSSSIQFNPFSRDFSDTITVPFQFSFIPFVGTNGANSGNVINEVSINFFGGYSAGTKSFEMASLFNINRGEMSGVQLAGLFNQVGGEVDGVQLAGLFNSNLDSVKGVQLAGLTNFTTGSVEGVQISGLANFSPKAVKGVQLAGLLNFSAADLEGSQIAGLLNFTAHEVKGSQVGLLNFGGKVDGFQLGLFNYADTMSGVPVGLMSFVRRGYHTVEFGTTDILPFNLALRSGKREFYTFFQAGIRPDLEREVTWSFGYGVGTSPRLGQKIFLNIEASSEQLTKGNVQAVNLINRFYVGGEWQATKRFAIYAGPTINFRVYETDFEGHPDLFTYSFPTLRNEKLYAENIGSQMWYGFKAGFRFF